MCVCSHEAHSVKLKAFLVRTCAQSINAQAAFAICEISAFCILAARANAVPECQSGSPLSQGTESHTQETPIGRFRVSNVKSLICSLCEPVNKQLEKKSTKISDTGNK